MKVSTAIMSLGLLSAAPAGAEETGDWRFRATGYAFVPDIAGAARFPAGSATIDITADELIDNANAGGMAAFEFQKGRFSGFVDAIYFDIGDSINDSPTLGQGSLPLPPGITADAALDIEAKLFTLGAGYRLTPSDGVTFDVFAGARCLEAETTLDWAFSAPFGPFAGPLQAGTSSISDDALDGIAGIKGDFRFGADREWCLPFYADVGAGDAELTWQAAAGLGRRFGQSEVIATWRYLRYEFGGDRLVEDIDFNGPAIGVSYRW
jgi:hypothetical protein